MVTTDAEAVTPDSVAAVVLAGSFDLVARSSWDHRVGFAGPAVIRDARSGPKA